MRAGEGEVARTKGGRRGERGSNQIKHILPIMSKIKEEGVCTIDSFEC
jgi:hypothetical protein